MVKVNEEVNRAIRQSQARIPRWSSWLTLTRCRKDQSLGDIKEQMTRILTDSLYRPVTIPVDWLWGYHFRTENCFMLNRLNKTRRPTNWWGSAKRDVTHPTATVVYNACHHLFRNVPALPCIDSQLHGRIDRDSIRHQPFWTADAIA